MSNAELAYNMILKQDNRLLAVRVFGAWFWKQLAPICALTLIHWMTDDIYEIVDNVANGELTLPEFTEQMEVFKLQAAAINKSFG